MREKVSILIVDDHAVLRSGLRLLLEFQGEFQVVGEAASGEEALEQIRELSPNIVVMDLVMPGMDGLTALLRIQESFPQVKVLVVTQHADRGYLLPALQAGASGYILKTASINDIISALRSVNEGKVFLDPSVTGTVLEDYRQRNNPQIGDPIDRLSDREKEVLRLYARGYTGREIGEQLVINVKTVDSHKGHLMAKLGLKTRSELVAYALKKGILPVASSSQSPSK